MKSKKLPKKLTLSKSTISNLNGKDMNAIEAGADTVIYCTNYTCVYPTQCWHCPSALHTGCIDCNNTYSNCQPCEN